MNKKRQKTILTFCLTLIIVAVLIFPIFWMVKISLTPKAELFTKPPRLTVSKLNYASYLDIFTQQKFLRYYLNSIIVAGMTVLICSLTSIFSAYSFSRFEYRGKRLLMIFSLTSQMFPAALLILTLYIFYQRNGLINTYFGIALAHSSFALPLSIWIIKSYFDTIPRELEDSAKIDGIGKMRTLSAIIIPLSTPGIIAATIYIFIFSWNDFIFGLTLATKDAYRILAPGITLTFLGQFEYLWSEMMAASILISLPEVLAFLFLQKYFVKGLTAGAVKQ
ncbi:MAG: carbohydrate ABC transporter permease [Spirochaetia bacterium]|jgi:multiple sugar transport system permease protein|nr:carbohydrate ABC transporter permease [Spirochaetia bacterium]